MTHSSLGPEDGHERGHNRPSPRIHPLFTLVFGLDSRARPSREVRNSVLPRRGPPTEGVAWNISGDAGLVSAGRIDKDTPPLTTPGRTSKSSAMDISSRTFLVGIHGAAAGPFRPAVDLRPVRPGARGGLSGFVCDARGRASPRFGTDSDLEAFSRYPTDGGFAALTRRTAASANYLNQRFLSY